jgi:hypothetical protein
MSRAFQNHHASENKFIFSHFRSPAIFGVDTREQVKPLFKGVPWRGVTNTAMALVGFPPR